MGSSKDSSEESSKDSSMVSSKGSSKVSSKCSSKELFQMKLDIKNKLRQTICDRVFSESKQRNYRRALGVDRDFSFNIYMLHEPTRITVDHVTLRQRFQYTNYFTSHG
jgi:hypothetical protein